MRDPSTRLRAGPLAWLLTIPTLLFVVAIWLDLTPWLRGPDEWRWPLRLLELPAGRIVLPVLFLGLYVGLCHRWLRAFDKLTHPAPVSMERGFLIFLTLAAPLIQFVLAAAVWRNPLFEFFAATVSPAVTGYYSVAVTTPDLMAELPRYTTFMQTLPIHPQTHPPGLVLIHWLGWRLFEAMPAVSNAIAMPLRALQCHNVALMTLDNPQIASSIIGMLAPALGGFAVWPMYAFGKRIAGAQRTAAATALLPVLPLFAMWPGQWDQVYPLLLFSGLYLAHTGLEAGSTRRLFAAGASLSLAAFLSIGNAVLVAIVALYGIITWQLRRKPRRLIPPAAAFLLGCASVWILYAALYRISLQELVATGWRLAFESTRCPICPSTTRSYNVWVLWNPIDFATFFSVPLTILFLERLPAVGAAIRAFLKRDAHSPSTPLRTGPDWTPIAIAALVSFVALDVSGIVRGEVGRMWLYFGPLLALIALASEPASGKVWGSSLLIGLVSLQLITLYTRWLVTPSFLDEPPERQASFAAPEPELDARASFDRQIALLGYDRDLVEGSLDMTLYWQALAQPSHAYTVFAHVLNGDGQLVGQQDNMPVRDQMPTSCWQPGEIVADPYHITLPAGARGPFSVEVGLYRLDTGQRLNRDDGLGTSMRLNVP